MPITAIQVKMARAALGLGVRELAKLADVSVDTVSRMERGEELLPRTVSAIRVALESAGIQFIRQNGGGPGVRLRERLTVGDARPTDPNNPVVDDGK